MTTTSYNPDVLSCLANLSNDEVFTPPSLANSMLDLLPGKLWTDPKSTFLDPVCKSGVFLREIAKRLDKGLESQIPDRQKRINHILSKQLYGVGITELTALLSRRSVYGSKEANGEYSFCESFDNEHGNIKFEKIQHSWQNSKCKYCGASQEVYKRDETSETYAYNFIHTDQPEKLFNMKFDVIVGNPPYQLNDGGGTGSSAVPIYHKFIEQAKKLNPTYLSMIIPARWFSGGRGLDEFRDEMLNDKRIRVLHDFIRADDVFPGVEIKGGVCYFLWQNNSEGKTKVITHKENGIILESERTLLEENAETYIRYNEAISILRKIQKFKEDSFSKLISANDPFGFDIRVAGSYKRVKPSYKKKPFADSVTFYYNGWQKEGVGYIDKKQIKKNVDWINDYKILIPKAWGIGSMVNDWLNPIIVESPSCCTETYLVIGPFKNEKTIKNVSKYIQTRFFHFLVLLIKNTQNAMKKVYSFVPMQDFSEDWTDEKLYSKYSLTTEEINFIESMIRPTASNKTDLNNE